MKKVLLSIVLLFSIYFVGHTQGLEIYHDGELVGDTILLYDDGNPDYELVFECNVKNTTDAVVRVGVIRYNIDTVTGTENSFCWAGYCTGKEVDTSLSNLVIPAGQSSHDGDFSGHYIANEKYGITIVKYTFYDIGNADVRDSVVVKYKYSPVGVSENAFSGVSFSNAYPNPATNSVSIDYSLANAQKASVKVINLLGNVVKSVNLPAGSGKATIDVSNLTQGVYFYSVVVDGNVMKTKKLIIK